MSEIITFAASSQVDALVTVCDSARGAYLTAAKQQSRMSAAVIKARAVRHVLNVATSTKEIVADLLAMADPEIGMVEIVGENISNEAKVRVMALALWNGFVPGDGEFAIFKHPTGASLYLKEPGLRKKLIFLGASDVRVLCDMPVQRQIEDGPTVWVVAGEASCVFEGELFRIQFSGPGCVKLPCKMYRDKSGRETASSDQIDAIQTKARRRMLQELYRTVAAVAGMQDDDDAGDDATGSGSLVVSGQPRRIEAAAKTSPLDALADRATTLANQVNTESGDALLRYHEKMQAATTHEQLNDAWRDFEAEQADRKFDGRVSNHLRNLGAAMREVLSGT